MKSSTTIIKHTKNKNQKNNIFTYLLNQYITNLLTLILIITLIFKISNKKTYIKYNNKINNNSTFPTKK